MKNLLIPPDRLQILKYLVNQAGGRFDNIFSAELNLAGVTHGFGEQLGQRVEFWVDGSGVSFVPPEMDLGAIASDPDFAASKKCSKGLSCGDSCISKNKTCRKPLTRAQAAQHMALIGRVMGTVAEDEGEQSDRRPQGRSGSQEPQTLADTLPEDPFDVPEEISPEDDINNILLDGLDDFDEDPPRETESGSDDTSWEFEPFDLGIDLSQRGQSGEGDRAADRRSYEEEMAVDPRPTTGPKARRYPQPIDTKDIPPPKDANRFSREIEIDGNRVEFYAIVSNWGDSTKNADVATIGFRVNGRYVAEGLDPSVGTKIAIEVEKISKEYVASLPDGAILRTSAMIGDGKGGQRTRAYQRAGYSDPVGGRAGGTQMGFVKDGRLVPYSPEQMLMLEQGGLYV